jgi:6-phosphogluconolactonase
MSPIKKKSPALSKPKKAKASPKAVKTKKSPQPIAVKTAPPKSKAPVFRPEIKIYPSAQLLYEETAPIVMMAAREAADTRGRFILALSGGTTPKGLFQQLAQEPYLNLIPWSKTFIFWADERHVALDHADSNYRMAQECFLSKVPIPKANLFPATNGGMPVDKAASLYEGKMKRFFGSAVGLPRIDLCLLGMGADGHTASLFPGVQQLTEQKRWAVGYFVDKEKKERVTLTLPVINASRQILVLVEGDKKAARVKDVLEGPSDPPRYPIQYLRPPNGGLVFAMDAAAASLLQKKS